MAGLLTCLPSVAMAQGTEDPRATQIDGNVVFEPGGRDDCPTLWPGSRGIELTDFDEDQSLVTINSVPDGIEITGVIVKGGDRYNKYDVANLGALPWEDLRSPNNASGKPADISHWFACGVDTVQTTTTTTGTTTTTDVTTTTDATTTTDTTAPGTTTTTEGVVPVGNSGDDNLAETGASPGLLLITALLLLLGGGLALLSPKVRTALSRR